MNAMIKLTSQQQFFSFNQINKLLFLIKNFLFVLNINTKPKYLKKCLYKKTKHISKIDNSINVFINYLELIIIIHLIN